SRRLPHPALPAPFSRREKAPPLADPRSRLRHNETLINGLDKIVRRPRTRIRTVAASVSPCWRRCFDLIQSSAAFDQVTNTVTNYGNHVAVLHHIELIANSAVSRNDECSFLTRDNRHRRDRQVNEPVERGNFALYTPTPSHLDNAETRAFANV